MLILLIIWAVALNWFAYRKNFYCLPKESKKNALTVTHLQLFISFGMYLFLALFLIPLFAKFLLTSLHKINPDIRSLPLSVLTGIQFGMMILIFVLLQSFMYSQDPFLCRKLWRNRPFHPIEFDLGIGAFTWLLSFPIVTILGEIIDFILKSYGITYSEQTAVKFVKGAAGSPLSLFFALFSVLIFAPLIEEFLFRGLLQTYLKKRIGIRLSVFFSALLFAFFHYFPSQGLGNISLILSLFLLGGYLGFLYERQSSLWAPIGLHMTFNTISALRILFFPETQ